MRFRQIHLDFHTSPLIEGIGSQFDKKEFQETLLAASVNSVTLFAYGHHGNAYFDTALGYKHPHLDFDLLRAQIDACHEVGIAAPVYITAGFNERIAEEHPEWLEVAPGSKVDVTPARGFRKLCFGTEYLDFLCKITKEVVEKFPDADGIFFDIISQNQCVCPTCRKGMEKQGLDPANEADRLKYARSVLMEYYRRSTEAARSVSPDMRVFHNSGNVAPDGEEILPYFSHLELESLPTGGWGYDHFPMTAALVRNMGKDFLGMTGKFHTTWGEFGGFKHPNALRYECAAMLAHGAKCSIGDQAHPTVKLDYSTYREVIAPAFAEVKEKEPWCDGVTSITKIAIVAQGGQRWGDDEDARWGAGRLLNEAHLTYDVVDTNLDWSKYDVLILPDFVKCTGKMAERIEEFRARGGRLVLSGPSSEGLKDLGFEDCGASPWKHDFVKVDEKFAPDFVHTPFIMYKGSRQIRPAAGAVSIGDVYAPYFNREPGKFCSHAQTPFRPEPSGFAAGVLTDKVLYFAHPLFILYRQTGAVCIKDFFINCLRAFLGGSFPVETVGLPSTGRLTWMRQEAEKRDVLHLLYANTVLRGEMPARNPPFFTCNGAEIIEELLPIGPVTATLKRPAKPSAVKLAPAGTALEFDYQDGLLTFTVPQFTCHQMVEIDD